MSTILLRKSYKYDRGKLDLQIVTEIYTAQNWVHGTSSLVLFTFSYPAIKIVLFKIRRVCSSLSFNEKYQAFILLKKRNPLENFLYVALLCGYKRN